tara:strand:+ start:367 stop:714 length:348 start_codon:yes stop_codon:yes gene_type:complete
VSTLKVDTLQTTSGYGLYPTNVAWNYDQRGPTIHKGLNVSSITDDAAGLFTVNFSMTMTDANYIMSALWINAPNDDVYRGVQGESSSATTSSHGFYAIANGQSFDNLTCGDVVSG